MYILAGIPRAPFIIQANSSNGGIILEVLTEESGTLPPSFFEFNVRAEHVATLKEVHFTHKKREYVDGNKVTLVMGMFRGSEEEDTRYRCFVRCTNKFGTSGESDPLVVIVKFKPPTPGKSNIIVRRISNNYINNTFEIHSHFHSISSSRMPVDIRDLNICLGYMCCSHLVRKVVVVVTMV